MINIKINGVDFFDWNPKEDFHSKYDSVDHFFETNLYENFPKFNKNIFLQEDFWDKFLTNKDFSNYKSYLSRILNYETRDEIINGLSIDFIKNHDFSLIQESINNNYHIYIKKIFEPFDNNNEKINKDILLNYYKDDEFKQKIVLILCNGKYKELFVNNRGNSEENQKIFLESLRSFYQVYQNKKINILNLIPNDYINTNPISYFINFNEANIYDYIFNRFNQFTEKEKKELLKYSFKRSTDICHKTFSFFKSKEILDILLEMPNISSYDYLLSYNVDAAYPFIKKEITKEIFFDCLYKNKILQNVLLSHYDFSNLNEAEKTEVINEYINKKIIPNIGFTQSHLTSFIERINFNWVNFDFGKIDLQNIKNYNIKLLSKSIPLYTNESFIKKIIDINNEEILEKCFKYKSVLKNENIMNYYMKYITDNKKEMSKQVIDYQNNIKEKQNKKRKLS